MFVINYSLVCWFFMFVFVWLDLLVDLLDLHLLFVLCFVLLGYVCCLLFCVCFGLLPLLLLGCLLLLAVVCLCYDLFLYCLIVLLT